MVIINDLAVLFMLTVVGTYAEVYNTHLCHEDKKTISCNSSSVISINTISYTSKKCLTFVENIEDDFDEYDVIKNKLETHCQYRLQCNISFFGTNDTDNCTMNIKPKILLPYNEINIVYTCSPIISKLSNILTTMKYTEWNSWECENCSNVQQRRRQCINDQNCNYPTCDNLRVVADIGESETNGGCNATDKTSVINATFRCNFKTTISSKINQEDRSINILPTKSLISTFSTKLVPTTVTKRYCEHETDGDENFKGKYTFVETTTSNTLRLPCVYGGLDRKEAVFLRKCIKINNSVTWAPLDLGNCAAKSYVTNQLLKLKMKNITKHNAKNISLSLKNITEDVNKLTIVQDIYIIADITNNLLKVNSTDSQVNTEILEVVDSLLGMEERTFAKFTGKELILDILKRVGISCQYKSNQSTKFFGKNIAFTRFAHSISDSLSLSAVLKENKKHQILFNATRQNHDVMISSLEISKRTFQHFPSDNNKLNMYCYSFKNDKLFSRRRQGNGNEKRVFSSVLDLSVLDYTVKDLTEDIVITFYIKVLAESFTCVYWNEETGSWSTDGCITSNVTRIENSSIIECKCNHLTNFAVLLNVGQPSESKVLSIISTVGCAISIVSLCLVLLHLLMYRDLLKSMASKILFNLSLSLLLLLVVFLFGVERTYDLYLCHIIATLIHYFTLSSFAWMAVTSIGLYRDVVRTFQYKGQGFNFFSICAILSWGIPIAIASTTYFLSRSQFKEAKSTCTINGLLSLITIVVPVSLILLFNCIMFMPIIRCIQKHLSIKSKYQAKENYWQRVRVTFGCSLLLGLTWIFGLLAIGEAKPIFEYLFAVLNSLQGFFIFLYHAMNNMEIKTTLKSLLLKFISGRKTRIKSTTTVIMDMSNKNEERA